MDQADRNSSLQYFLHNRVCRAVLVCFGTWFFFRYLFPLTAPFALAFLLTSMLYPLLQKMQKRVRIKKKFLAIGLAVPCILIGILLLWGIGTVGMEQFTKIPEFYDEIGGQAEIFFRDCCCRLDGLMGWKGEELQSYLELQIGRVMDDLELQWMPRVVASSYSCFRGILAVGAFLAVMLISLFLLEKEYATFVEWLRKGKDTAFVWDVAQGVISYLMTFIKAQGVILLVISILCATVLRVAGIRNGILIGILAGFLDMMPFIGTGIVLVPLSVWQLINGHYVRMGICLLLYGECAFLREWLEPKLIGRRIGIPPVLMLLALYAGVKLFGVAGIIKGPLALVVIREILRTDRGWEHEKTHKMTEIDE